MKQKIKPYMIALAFSLISFSSFAQQEEKPIVPKWVSDKGYWVVEGNIHTPLDHIIWFYNNDNVLIYKESVSGIKIDPAKRRTKMKLKKALESAVADWEKNKVPEENKDYISAILR